MQRHIQKDFQFFCRLPKFRLSSKKPKCCLGGYQILATETILFFLSIKLSLTHIPLGLKFQREIDHSNSTSAMAGQNNFFPDPSIPYHYYNSYSAYVYGSYPENSERSHWHYLREEQQSQASQSSSPSSSIMPVEEPSSAGSSPE